MRTAVIIMTMWAGFPALSSEAAPGPGDTFTYQAQLKQGGVPLNGTANIVVSVFDVAVGDLPLGSNTFPGVVVTDGLVALDVAFAPGTFDGNARWLEIAVDGNTLSPRQPVFPTPYAMHAGSVGWVPETALLGTYSSPVDLTHPLNTFSGSGANLTTLNASQLTTGVVPSSAIGGVWTNASSRDLKENLTAVDGAALLDKLAELDVLRWNYHNEDDTIQHIGPMAEDFAAAFGFGDSDKAIGTIDADGVALAAIQALHARVKASDAEITTLRAEVEELRSLVQQLATR